MHVPMPVMDGIEATQIIRTRPPFCTDPQLHGIPIIGILTDRSLKAKQACIAAGMNDYIYTPLFPRVLTRKLCQFSKSQVVRDQTRGPA
ncbi:hypothetical protein DH86_00002878, partial [Scytalidium sp. 3C]